MKKYSFQIKVVLILHNLIASINLFENYNLEEPK